MRGAEASLFLLSFDAEVAAVFLKRVIAGMPQMPDPIVC